MSAGFLVGDRGEDQGAFRPGGTGRDPAERDGHGCGLIQHVDGAAPQTSPSTRSAANGSRDQFASSTGTTSVWARSSSVGASGSVPFETSHQGPALGKVRWGGQLDWSSSRPGGEMIEEQFSIAGLPS